MVDRSVQLRHPKAAASHPPRTVASSVTGQQSDGRRGQGIGIGTQGMRNGTGKIVPELHRDDLTASLN
jgi:hypothetical protein